jgi:hypothetical protein
MTNEHAVPRGRDGKGAARPTDGEVWAIAQQLIREQSDPPPASPGDHRSAPQFELSPADEARVEAAIVELGAARRENTSEEEKPSPSP